MWMNFKTEFPLPSTGRGIEGWEISASALAWPLAENTPHPALSPLRGEGDAHRARGSNSSWEYRGGPKRETGFKTLAKELGGWSGRLVFCFSLAVCLHSTTEATPANKSALERHYDKFLATELNRCSTCHLPSANKAPENLDEFPHNPFGHRLRLLGKELARDGMKKDIPTRLAIVAKEDSDGDGVNNETELLLGHNPGDPKDTPSKKELAGAKKRRAEFRKYLASYRWQPFETVKRPPVP